MKLKTDAKYRHFSAAKIDIFIAMLGKTEPNLNSEYKNPML
jgi:hypothetical protein